MSDTAASTPAPPQMRVVPAPPGSAPAPRRIRLRPPPQWDPVLAAMLAPDPASAAGGPAPGQQELPLDFVLPSGLPAVPGPALVVLPAPRRPLCDDEDEGPARTARADLPDPQLWAARLAQAVVEVCAGGRPLTQLLRWTSNEVYCELAGQYRPRVRPTARPGSNVRVLRQRCDQVRSVHVCEPADGVAEASAVVAGTTRWWALALRLEGLNGRWVLTRVEFV
jgi:hypothetical protein